MIKEAKNGNAFMKKAKPFVVNMVQNRGTLHKKCGCYYGKFLYKYVDFDTEEEARASEVYVKACKNCFK